MQSNATLAQLVEQRFCKAKVLGSNPRGGSAIKEEIGSKNMDQILEALAEVVNDSDSARRSYVRGKLPDIISYSEKKSALLKQIVQSIATGIIAESSQTLSVVQGMSDFWNTNPELKKEFAKELKTVGNKSEKGLKEIMIKSSNELVPPPEPKTKKDITENDKNSSTTLN
jgi:flagellar biosynthesis component FlhA